MKEISYRSTILACYAGNFVQSIIINVTPILFVPLMAQYGLSFEQMGRLVLINFLTQVTVDILFSKPVEKHGFRPFVVTAHVLAFIGLILFALTPLIFNNVYVGFVLATVIFSGSGGLLELLLSPIVNTIPTEEKAAAMSLLHSFYSWGQLTVVLATTLLLLALGSHNWPIILILWSIVPLINSFAFAKAPLAPPIAEEKRTRLRTLFKERFFIVCLLAILVGGAAEQVMAQWSSSFIEKAAGLPKAFGDTAGVCMFALMMAIVRTLYGRLGSRLNVRRVMTWGALLSTVCYLAAVFSPWPVLSLVACALCGLGVALLWPGSLIIAADRFPLAGASMFAIMAAAGDSGASVGPWLVGWVADKAPAIASTGIFNLPGEELGLRAGLLLATLFPLAMLLCMRYLNKGSKNAGV